MGGGVHTEEEMGNVLEHPNKNPQEEITRSSVCLLGSFQSKETLDKFKGFCLSKRPF